VVEIMYSQHVKDAGTGESGGISLYFPPPRKNKIVTEVLQFRGISPKL